MGEGDTVKAGDEVWLDFVYTDKPAESLRADVLAVSPDGRSATLKVYADDGPVTVVVGVEHDD